MYVLLDESKFLVALVLTFGMLILRQRQNGFNYIYIYVYIYKDMLLSHLVLLGLPDDLYSL